MERKAIVVGERRTVLVTRTPNRVGTKASVCLVTALPKRKPTRQHRTQRICYLQRKIWTVVVCLETIRMASWSRRKIHRHRHKLGALCLKTMAATATTCSEMPRVQVADCLVMTTRSRLSDL